MHAGKLGGPSIPWGGRCGYFGTVKREDLAPDASLMSRGDLARWSGLPERHPLVGLFHRLGGLRKTHDTFGRLAHLQGEAFIDGVFDHLGVTLEVDPNPLDRIPESGPFILVSNHPFGVLDGLALLREVRKRRPDFQMGVDGLLGDMPQLSDHLIALTESGEAPRKRSLSGWREATRQLEAGGGLGVFPAGRVSGFRRSARVVVDGRWNATVIGWVAKQSCPVIPVFIDGANSPLFQLLGLIHPSLRSLRVASELHNKKGHVLRMRFGRPLRSQDLAGFEGHEHLARFLRARTYALGSAFDVRREQFRRFRFPNRAEDIAPVTDPQRVSADVSGLQDALLFRQGEFEVYLAAAERIPHVLQEVGRLREITFRAVGEGTNRASDLDEYDLYYQHLLLWDAEAQKLAGAYRVGLGWEIMERYGNRGFYTHSLFRMKAGFDRVLNASVELGRSFIVPEYQRQRWPLFLLWKGILSVLVRSPEARYVLGPVTISSDYTRFSRALIMAFVRRHYWDDGLAAHIRPRKRFAFEEKRVDAEALLAAADGDMKQLDRILADIEPSQAVAPVLLKKYLHQNARILGFNRDPQFNNALDGLMLLDVQDLPAETVENLQREFDLG